MPAEGQMILDEITHRLMVFDGQVWVPCGSEVDIAEGKVTFLPDPSPVDIEMEITSAAGATIRDIMDKRLMGTYKEEHEKAYDRAMKGIEHE